MCEDLEIISRISNISQSVMTEDHLKRDIPVIITDGMDDWEEADKLSMLFIKQVGSMIGHVYIIYKVALSMYIVS